MDPQAVSGLQIGDFGDGQRDSGALHANVDFRADEVEGGIVGAGRGCQKQKKNERKRPPRFAGRRFVPGECRVTQGIILPDSGKVLRHGGWQTGGGGNCPQNKTPQTQFESWDVC